MKESGINDVSGRSIVKFWSFVYAPRTSLNVGMVCCSAIVCTEGGYEIEETEWKQKVKGKVRGVR